jgi:hypothetical protein
MRRPLGLTARGGEAEQLLFGADLAWLASMRMPREAMSSTVTLPSCDLAAALSGLLGQPRPIEREDSTALPGLEDGALVLLPLADIVAVMAPGPPMPPGAAGAAHLEEGVPEVGGELGLSGRPSSSAMASGSPCARQRLQDGRDGARTSGPRHPPMASEGRTGPWRRSGGLRRALRKIRDAGRRPGHLVANAVAAAYEPEAVLRSGLIGKAAEALLLLLVQALGLAGLAPADQADRNEPVVELDVRTPTACISGSALRPAPWRPASASWPPASFDPSSAC